MVEKIKATKDQVLQHMERELAKYGGDRIDVKQMGELADIVKDLAEAEKSCWEAEYYRSISEAMEGGSSGYSGYGGGSGGSSGYGGGSMGYSGSGGGSAANGGRRGYGGGGGGGGMGHTDPISNIREMLASANPEKRAQIRNEISGLMSM